MVIFINTLIEKYILNLKKEDIIKFANYNNLKTTDNEINLVYNYIKTNYKNILNNPSSFNIEQYKNNFSNENYLFINKLANKYLPFIKK